MSPGDSGVDQKPSVGSSDGAAQKVSLDLGALSIKDFVDVMASDGGCIQLAGHPLSPGGREEAILDAGGSPGTSFPSPLDEGDGTDSTFLTSLSMTQGQGQGQSGSSASHSAAAPRIEDVMMMLDGKVLKRIEKEFRMRNRGMHLDEFVGTLTTLLKVSDQSEFPMEGMVSCLVDLFADIDIDCDGELTWDEFYTYLHERGMRRAVDGGGGGSDGVGMKIDLVAVRPSKFSFKKTAGVKDLQYKNWVAVWEAAGFSLRLVDWSKGTTVIDLKQQSGVADVIALPYARFFAVSLTSHNVAIWDTASVWDLSGFAQIKSLPCTATQTALCCQSDLQRLVCCGADGMITIFNVPAKDCNPTVITRQQGHGDVIRGVIDSISLNALLTAGMDKKVKMWDRESLELRRQFTGPTMGIHTLAYSGHLRAIIAASTESDLTVFTPFMDKSLYKLSGHVSYVQGMVLTDEGKKLVSWDGVGVTKIWDLVTSECIQTLTVDKRMRGHIIAAIWDSQKSRVTLCANQFNQSIVFRQSNHPHLSCDTPLVTAMYSDVVSNFITAESRMIRLWDARNGKMIRVTKTPDQYGDISSVSLDSLGRKLIVGTELGAVLTMNAISGAIVRKLDEHELEVSAVGYMGLDRCIVTASWDGTVCVHDDGMSISPVGNRLRVMHGHKRDITSMASSWDMGFVASAGVEGFIHVWDYFFARLQGTCLGHASDICSIIFLEPFPILASADTAGNVAFWFLPPAYPRFCPFQRFVNADDDGKACGVQAMAWSASSEQLLLGDDAGRVVFLDVAALISASGTKPVAPRPASSTEEMAVRRRATVTLPPPPPVSTTERWKPPKLRTGTTVPECPLPTVTRAVFAHNGGIRAMNICANRDAIVTTGNDMLVNLWSIEDGSPLGTLRQGGSTSWKFDAGVDDKESARTSRIDGVASSLRATPYEIHCREENENIVHRKILSDKERRLATAQARLSKYVSQSSFIGTHR